MNWKQREEERNYHEIANLFPLMDGPEFEELKSDIAQNGLLEPIYLHQNGSILDGRNRHRACIETDTKPRFETWNGSVSPVQFVVSKNLHRRHLTSSQRAAISLDALGMLEEEARERQRWTPTNVEEIPPSQEEQGKARDQAASMFQTNPRYVQDAKKLRNEAPDLLDEVKAGKKSIPQAKREHKRRQVLNDLDDIATQEVKAVEGVYDVVVIDPPWPMRKIERDVTPEQVEFEYPTMTEAELADMSVPCADDCHVWLWTTHKFLPMALRLLDTWGLKYVCTFTWHKPGGFQPFGLPQYNCEFAIYARKGSPIFTETKAFPVCFNAPRGAHSEKPSAFYEMIRRVTAGRRIDMFARKERIGFDVWGNEV